MSSWSVQSEIIKVNPLRRKICKSVSRAFIVCLPRFQLTPSTWAGGGYIQRRLTKLSFFFAWFYRSKMDVTYIEQGLLAGLQVCMNRMHDDTCTSSSCWCNNVGCDWQKFEVLSQRSRQKLIFWSNFVASRITWYAEFISRHESINHGMGGKFACVTPACFADTVLE